MKLSVDFKTDNSDDIFLNGDISFENDPGTNALKNAERRITARFDDFVLVNISAGIERYLGQKINDMTRQMIQQEIKRVLATDSLLLGNEYQLAIPQIQNSRKMPVLIKFTSPYIADQAPFKVLINLENQRSYK